MIGGECGRFRNPMGYSAISFARNPHKECLNPLLRTNLQSLYKIVLKSRATSCMTVLRSSRNNGSAQWLCPRSAHLSPQTSSISTLGGVSGITANERRMTGEEFLKGLKASWEDHITTMKHDYGRIDVYGSSFTARQQKGIHFHHINGPFPRSHPTLPSSLARISSRSTF